MAKVTVVICTRLRPVLLTRCLSSVARLKPAPTRIVVVDNSKGDEDTEKVARKFGAHYTIEPKPGLKRARERALAEFGTEEVVFLDDDATPEAGWLGTILASAKKKKTGTKGRVLDIQSLRPKVEQKSPHKAADRAKREMPNA